MGRVFSRIKAALHYSPNIDDVERALDGLELAMGHFHGSPQTLPAGSKPMLVEASGPAHAPTGCSNSDVSPPHGHEAASIVPAGLGHDTRETLNMASLEPNDEEDQHTGSDNDDAQPADIDALFKALTSPALSELPAPPPQPRRSRNTDATTARRSARLAKKSCMPVIEMAQQNLWRKLGILHDDIKPLEQVLKDVVAMFTGHYCRTSLGP